MLSKLKLKLLPSKILPQIPIQSTLMFNRHPAIKSLIYKFLARKQGRTLSTKKPYIATLIFRFKSIELVAKAIVFSHALQEK